MLFTNVALPLLASLTLTSAAPNGGWGSRRGSGGSNGAPSNQNVPQEYYTLGCPQNTTKPIATWQEQIDVLLDFTQRLYEEQDVYAVFDQYVAVDYINHAPEVTGPGRDIAASFLANSLPGGNVALHERTFGYNQSGSAFGTTHFKGYSPAFGYGAIMYLQRFIGTCIVEGWDVATGITNSSNPIAYF